MLLSAPQGRVVGSLIEKQLTTPQQYPLTANALVLACNQASNRHPVVAYTEEEVCVVLDALREQRLVRYVLPSHGRSVVRYRHVLDEVLGVDVPQLALLAVLLLRGPQTVGELRARTERMTTFDSLAAVEHDLDRLAGMETPLVARLPRRPGQKEERWTELLRAEGAGAAGAAGPAGAAEGAGPAGGVRPFGEVGPFGEASTPPAGAGSPGAGAAGEPANPAAAPAGLTEEVAALREEVAALREGLEALRSSLGG